MHTHHDGSLRGSPFKCPQDHITFVGGSEYTRYPPHLPHAYFLGRGFCKWVLTLSHLPPCRSWAAGCTACLCTSDAGCRSCRRLPWIENSEYKVKGENNYDSIGCVGA